VIESLRPIAARRWRDLFPERPPLAGALLIGNGKAPSSKVSFLFFDGRGEPAVVAKVARNDVAERALGDELQALEAVRATGAPSVLDGAPTPMGLERVDGRATLMLTGLAGRPLYAAYHTPGHTSDARIVAADFTAAADWLARFQRETAAGAARVGPEFVRSFVDPVLARYRRDVGWDDVEDAFFADVGERLRALDGTPIPLAASHGDFWMGNLLLEGGRVTGVIDWEVAGVARTPFRDLYKFPTSYAFYMDRAWPGRGGAVPGHPGREDAGGRWRRFGDWPNLLGFGHAFFGEGWFPELVRRWVDRQLGELGLPAEVNAAFFPLFLAEQATALDVPEFRDGYRSLLHALAAERSQTWLWAAGSPTGDNPR
jgi:hypothetical protein